MTALVPGSRLARFVACAQNARDRLVLAAKEYAGNGYQQVSLGVMKLVREHDEALSRLLDSTSDETAPERAVSAEQAAAIVEDAPPTSPSVAPQTTITRDERAVLEAARAYSIAYDRNESFGARGLALLLAARKLGPTEGT